MWFDVVTIFPHIFDSYFGESILRRAQKEQLVNIQVHNLRDYTTDKHKTVDDVPYGGGAGMVLKVEPIYKCVEEIKSEIRNPKQIQNSKFLTRTILFSAKGKRFTQRDAERLAKYDQLILVCGRYEGVDERVAENVADEEISIGDYVLTGGEIPAMVLVDSIARLIPGVLGNPDSLKEESFGNKIQNSKFKIQNSVLEYPQYTRPENFHDWKVPTVLTNGNHQEIAAWRAQASRTRKKRT